MEEKQTRPLPEVKIPTKEGKPLAFPIASFDDEKSRNSALNRVLQAMTNVPGADGYFVGIIQKENRGQIVIVPVDEETADIGSAVRSEYLGLSVHNRQR